MYNRPYMGEKIRIQRPLHTAGQTRETIDFTSKLLKEGKISPDEKLRLDNLAIRENALANLSGFETYAEEKPGEWKNFLKSKKLKKKKADNI